jgi:hypothetical protein
MRTLLATAALATAAALALAGAVTVQAAEVFSCSGLGYAIDNGKLERVCASPVTTHWTKLGEHLSALVYYINERDGFHVVVTTQRGERQFDAVLAAGQSVAVSIPRAAGEAPARIVLSNAGDHLDIAEPPNAVSAQ